MTAFYVSVTVQIETTAPDSPELRRYELTDAVRKAIQMPEVMRRFNSSNGATHITGIQIHSAQLDV